jgi:uroporphyrinogen-III synthase
LKILVTRPAHQAEPLCTLIAAEGGQAIRLPVIEIVDVEDQSPLRHCRTHLNEIDIAIFISTNAVEKTLPTLLESGNLPTHLQLIGVGQRTVEALTTRGLPAHCPPPPYNSEAVLTMPQLQPATVQNKQIVIFRGEGGRELLAETLQQRGAKTTYVNVYRRHQPPVPNWLNDQLPVDIIIITSGEGLQNLFTMLTGQEWLPHTPLVVMSQRLVTEAQQLGSQAPIWIAPTASDEGLLSATLQAAAGNG